MKIYPAIDIKEGKCVRLIQGDFNQKTIYGDDPVKQALKIESEGAKYLHVVDLDGALGDFVNVEVIKEIIKNTSLKIELGGGIKTFDIAKKWLEIGVNRIIIGSKALSDITFVETLIKEYGSEKIVVGIDALNGYVAVNGWKTVSDIKVIDFAKKLIGVGVKYVVFTDISKDGMLIGPNLMATKEIIDLGLYVTASGGVSENADISHCLALGCDSVIIGKAYYTGRIDLNDVIKRFGE